MNDQPERNWGAEPARMPTVKDGETVIYSECGRVMDNTCYRSHWFILVQEQYGGYLLRVKHGAGEEQFKPAWNKRIVASLADMSSDNRYFMLHALHDARKLGERIAGERTALEYRTAFAEGRLCKRKVRGQAAVKVWIERAPMVRA